MDLKHAGSLVPTLRSKLPLHAPPCLVCTSGVHFPWIFYWLVSSQRFGPVWSCLLGPCSEPTTLPWQLLLCPLMSNRVRVGMRAEGPLYVLRASWLACLQLPFFSGPWTGQGALPACSGLLGHYCSRMPHTQPMPWCLQKERWAGNGWEAGSQLCQHLGALPQSLAQQGSVGGRV